MNSSLQGEDFAGHCERAACLCWRVWSFVRGGPGVKRREERSRFFMRRGSGAESGECGKEKRGEDRSKRLRMCGREA